MNSTQSIDQRVQKGAKLLDEKLDYGWWNEIDIVSLDMESSRHCILGQLFDRLRITGENSYDVGRRVLRINIIRELRLGFCSFRTRDFGKLTAAWKSLILSRRTPEVMKAE